MIHISKQHLKQATTLFKEADCCMKHETSWVNRRNVQTCTKGLSSNKSQNSTELIRHIYALCKKNKMLWWWLPMLLLTHTIWFAFFATTTITLPHIFPTALILLHTHKRKNVHSVYLHYITYTYKYYLEVEITIFCNNITSTFQYNFCSCFRMDKNPI